jgi:hypothetical protein
MIRKSGRRFSEKIMPYKDLSGIATKAVARLGRKRRSLACAAAALSRACEQNSALLGFAA